MPSTTQRSTLFRVAVAIALSSFAALASESPAVVHFRKTVQPILAEYCYDCHADGAKKGNVAFDEFKSDEELLAKRDLWFAALKNVRAGLMPPEKKPKPSAEQKKALETFIKTDVFEIDPANPDPGKVTIRRLNRNEYRNTIHDLMGYDYKVEEELPPDDTGYGFDTIGDVLTMSPLLMEKYMQAAETITRAAVPRTSLMAPEKTLVDVKPRGNGPKMSFYETNTVSKSFKVEKAGTYRVNLDLEVLGQFNFDPGETHVTFKAGDKELFAQNLKWQSHHVFNYSFEDKWEAGDKPLVMEMTPVTPKDMIKNSLELRVIGLRVEGPLEKQYWVHPKNFERFFTKEPPTDATGRREYAREVLKRFADRAYRRPVDERTLSRLVGLAEQFYTAPGKKFEDGIAEAMTPILASPRFLFRIEETEPGGDANLHPNIDEYALASRLSYFLWSTMPDAELFGLARKHELRKKLGAEVERMLKDPRSDAFVQNFVGQWLQARDVEGIDINVRAVLGRDGAEDPEVAKKRKRLEELRDIPDNKLTPEQNKEIEALRKFLFSNRKNVQNELDGNLRRALREEAEKVFAYIAREDRSIVEFINADYTFLNEKLAAHYGIKDVTGQEMRLVKLPADSPRGGILTEGVTLIVTSNPTRTSPVKRGLFVLDNILGMPPPPPPPDVPALEQSKDQVSDHEPTVRELLEIHRAKPLCSSCHNRMDPLGFALENFNAMGMWREKERGQKIDATGSLITGEKFASIREVKDVLATKYRENFYRCLTEKMMIYALGRGLEYYDVEAVDRIVENLNQHDGHFSALLSGIIESAPFQKRRTPGFAETLP